MKKFIYTDSIKSFVDRYDKANHHIWNSTTGEIVEVRSAIRSHYLHEQGYRCAYCQIEKKETHGLTWDIEHVLAKAVYPQYLFESENLAVACKECNIPKDDSNVLVKNLRIGAAFPCESKDYCIVHPHFDNYYDHFEVTIVRNKRIYRMLNGEKALNTYIACNLSRFDYKFAEWDCFESALVEEFSEFLDNCPKDATPAEIKRMLGHFNFTVR